MKKSIITISISLIFLIIGYFSVSGQSFSKQEYFVSPGLTIGYTIGAKINYGFVLDLGKIDKTNNGNLRYGFSFYYYFVQTKTHLHRLRSFSLMAQTDFLDIKLGIGRAKNPWGYQNGNRCIVRGLCFDISGAYPNIYSPWLGYRYFKFNRADWAWFFTPYNSIYLKYKYDIIQNTSLQQILKPE